MRKLGETHVKQHQTQLAKIKALWQKNLESLGVKWPSSLVKQAQLVGLSFFIGEPVTREGRAGAKDWHELCVLYKGKCAHCGATTKKADKGHMDPAKPATIDNLLPLCVPCNNWAADDVIFGPDGRIIAFLSERFLKAADATSRKRILSWLSKNV